LPVVVAVLFAELVLLEEQVVPAVAVTGKMVTTHQAIPALADRLILVVAVVVQP
jgi:hypothetical protein